MTVLYIFLIVIGVVLCFWTGLIVGHKEGLYIGAVLIAVGVLLLLIKTGEINDVVNTINNL